MRILAICGLGLGLLAGGCMTQGRTAVEAMTVESPPVSFADMKRTLLAERARIWKDPDSVRGAKIGEPYRCPLGGTCICVEANAKNSFGGFTGVQLSGFKFVSATQFEALGKMGAYATCGRMAPFPEMNGRGA